MNQKMFSPITLDELAAVIQHSVMKAVSDIQKPEATKMQDSKIFGNKGLAEFLQCSEPTAIKIGKSGKFPRYQEGRKIFFYESEILNGLSK